MRILVIDGQGGNIGKLIVKSLTEQRPDLILTAVGTNSVATQAMLRAGASEGATGENAVVVCARRADIIIGPIGIAIPNAMLGEVTPVMAEAVGSSSAKRILIPMYRCDTMVVGVSRKSVSSLVDEAVSLVLEQIDTQN